MVGTIIPKEKAELCYKEFNCAYLSFFYSEAHCLHGGVGAVQGSIPNQCPLGFKGETPVVTSKPAHEPISPIGKCECCKELKEAIWECDECKYSWHTDYEEGTRKPYECPKCHTPNSVFLITMFPKIKEKGIDQYDTPTADDSLVSVQAPKGQIQSAHAIETNPVVRNNKTPAQQMSDFACPYCGFMGGATFIGEGAFGAANVWSCPDCRSLFSLSSNNKWIPVFDPITNQNDLSVRDAIEAHPLGPHKQNEKISDQEPSSRTNWSPKEAKMNATDVSHYKKPNRCPFCWSTQIQQLKVNSWLCNDCRATFLTQVEYPYQYSTGMAENTIPNIIYPVQITSRMDTGTEGGEFTPMGVRTDKAVSSETDSLDLMTISEWTCFKDWNPFKEAILAFIAKLKFQFAANKPDGFPRITKPEKDDIKEIFEDAFKHNRSINHISNKIQEVIGDADRANMIARTESVRIVNEAFLNHMEEKGFTRVRFVVGPEYSAHGQFFPCKECDTYKDDNLTISKARGILPVHCNCRCHFEVVLNI